MISKDKSILAFVKILIGFYYIVINIMEKRYCRSLRLLVDALESIINHNNLILFSCGMLIYTTMFVITRTKGVCLCIYAN